MIGRKFRSSGKGGAPPWTNNRVMRPRFVRFRTLSIFPKYVSTAIPLHSSIITMGYYPYELSRRCETPFFKHPEFGKLGVRLLTRFSLRFCLRIHHISQKKIRLRRSEGGALINFWFWESELRGVRLLRGASIPFCLVLRPMVGKSSSFEELETVVKYISSTSFLGVNKTVVL